MIMNYTSMIFATAAKGERIPVHRGNASGDAAGNVIGEGEFDV
jgi:hypothetical protein